VDPKSGSKGSGFKLTLRRAFVFSLLALVVVLASAGRSEAAPITVNFCPGDPTCPVGVTQASLTFTEIVNKDPNDYIVELVIKGNASAPAFVDEVSFKIAGVKNQEYEALPTLINAPNGGSPWVVFFDNVSGGTNSCVANTGQQHAVCAQSGPGSPSNFGAALPGKTLTWKFSVNLVNSVGPITSPSQLNLRAQFLNAKGKNVGILSPGGGGSTPVPEPATLALLALGCALIPATRRLL
jgi:hypothetical protein